VGIFTIDTPYRCASIICGYKVINPLRAKSNLFYLKTHFLPRTPSISLIETNQLMVQKKRLAV
jgi:hypothetical protein